MFPYCSVVLPLLRFSLSFLSRLPGMDQSFSSWLHGQNSLFPIQTCSSATPEKSFCWGRPWFWLIHLIISPQMWGSLSSRHAWCPDQASPAGLADMACTRLDVKDSLALPWRVFSRVEVDQYQGSTHIQLFFLLIITTHSLRPSPLCGHKWNPCLGQYEKATVCSFPFSLRP